MNSRLSVHLGPNFSMTVNRHNVCIDRWNDPVTKLSLSQILRPAFDISRRFPKPLWNWFESRPAHFFRRPNRIRYR